MVLLCFGLLLLSTASFCAAFSLEALFSEDFLADCTHKVHCRKKLLGEVLVTVCCGEFGVEERCLGEGTGDALRFCDPEGETERLGELGGEVYECKVCFGELMEEEEPYSGELMGDESSDLEGERLR